jgi:1,2-phenylacetyl-CoA epoxidase catalytic subunit
MSDQIHRIAALERRLEELETHLKNLTRIIRKLSEGAERRRETTQAAIDNLQLSVRQIYKNIEVPNARFNPNHRDVIE